MRYSDNPILTPRDLRPSREGMKIECLLNPGAFRFDGRTWLLVRVAERPEQHDGEISFPMLDAANRMTIMRVPTINSLLIFFIFRLFVDAEQEFT